MAWQLRFNVRQICEKRRFLNRDDGKRGSWISRGLFMWILRYQYDLENGESVHVSFCIDSTGAYSIGRSSKNHLIIKNDKSISREHIRFAWNREQSCLWFANIGKLTVINGKYLKPQENVTFEESTSYTKPVILELGTHPIKVDICWQDQLWNIPLKCFGLEDTLRNNGIRFNSIQNAEEGYNLVVVNDDSDSNWEQCLFAIVNRLKIMKFQFLDEICEMLSQRRTDFDAEWLKILNNTKYMLFPNLPTDANSSIFDGLNFCLIEGRKYMLPSVKTSLELGGGNVVLIGDLDQIRKKIESENVPSNLIILTMGDSQAVNVNLKVHTLRDFVEATIKGDIYLLFVRRQEANSKRIAPLDEESLPKSTSHSKTHNDFRSPTNIEASNSVAPLVKRRRLNRERVKPLDSLMFFAGGDSVISEQGKSVSIPIQPVSIKIEGEEIQPNQENEKADTNKKSTVRDRMSSESAPVDVSAKNDSNDSTNDIRKSQKRTITKKALTENTKSPKLSGEIVEAPNTVKEDEGKWTAGLNKGTKPPGTYGANQQGRLTPKEEAKNLVQVIHDTKNREVKRLNSSIVQIDLEELTDEAINRLGNITLVQKNDSLLRPTTSVRISKGSDENPEWEGRKNFKNFSKFLPRYRQNQSGNEQNGTANASNSIRSSAFLIAREYVPLKKYSKNSIKPNSNEVDEFVQPCIDKERSDATVYTTLANVGADGHSFSFSRSATGSTNALFVTEESDSEMVSFTEPNDHGNDIATNRVSPPKRTARSRSAMRESEDHDTEDEEDDDGPKFKFKRRQA